MHKQNTVLKRDIIEFGDWLFICLPAEVHVFYGYSCLGKVDPESLIKILEEVAEKTRKEYYARNN